MADLKDFLDHRTVPCEHGLDDSMLTLTFPHDTVNHG